MKKLMLVFALLAGVMFVSCGRGSETDTKTVDSVEVVIDSVDTVSVDTLVVDSVAVDTIQ